MLQIGLPPRRIDILNRAEGITFDEAVAESQSFELEGRRIPVIGLQALLKNKRAAGGSRTSRTSRRSKPSAGAIRPRDGADSCPWIAGSASGQVV